MPKIKYIPRDFRSDALDLIEKCNRIIEDYQSQGFRLTLRQIFYQCVSSGYIPNTQREYKRLGSIVNDARLAGLIDWEAIEDRTRNLASLSHWGSPNEIISACAQQYRVDKWATQPYRVEVWIEKEALASVFERVCQEFDVPFLCCRGYTSQSEMWGASIRLRRYNNMGQKIIILHFGDHDPSGIDMSRDIQDRLINVFGCVNLEFKRIALNMDQVRQYNPPPNPAKEEDSRFAGYISQYGHESWELDALEPLTLENLVRDHVMDLWDLNPWKKACLREERERKQLTTVSKKWKDVLTNLRKSK